MRKLTYEFVKEAFNSIGYTLLSSEYINAFIKLNYRCGEGHVHTIRWADFQQGARCPTCHVLSTRSSYVDIKKTFEREGYILISKEYRNNKERLDYICKRGHSHYINWNNWCSGYRCPFCTPLDQEEGDHWNWKGGVSKNNLPLYATHHKFLARYNNICIVLLDDLELLGVECTFCKKVFVPTRSAVSSRRLAIKEDQGAANFYCSEKCKQLCPIYAQKLWPKGHKNTIRRDQAAWAKMVKVRDNYTCQKCGAQNKVMIAHHRDPVINNPVESADVDNGITLCKRCDILAHKIPGCSSHELQCS